MCLSQKLARRVLATALIILASAGFVSLVVRADAVIGYRFADRGGISLMTSGSASVVIAGYARIQPDNISTTPAGLAIYGLRQGGVLVSETGVPASPLIKSGRLYAEVVGSVRTGVAFANPNATAAAIDIYFTDGTGADFGSAKLSVPANGQISKFLDEAPFNLSRSLQGTFTFTSSVPVSVIALRGLTNELGQFLVTTLPVTSLDNISTTLDPTIDATIFPHFVDGAGWTTQVILVNPRDNAMTGTFQFFSPGNGTDAGQPQTVTLNDGRTGSAFPYSIPKHAAIRFLTSGTPTSLLSGTIRITPTPSPTPGQSPPTPTGLLVLSNKTRGVTVSEAGVPATRPATDVRIFAEASDAPSLISTGVAVANATTIPVTVNFELTTLTGGAPIFSGTTTIPGDGQIAKFLNEIPGLEKVPLPFQGILRISASYKTGIAVLGLRTRYNEQNNFLMTTIPTTDESETVSTTEVIFPHFVDNGGFSTQFILFSRYKGQQSSGQIRFFGQNSQALDLGMPVTDLAVTQTGPMAPVTPGNGVAYSITVTNRGRDATGVQLTDLLPPETVFLSATPRQGTCPVPAGNVLVCNLDRLAPGATTVVDVLVTAPSKARLVNTVNVRANENDALSDNNGHSATTVAGISADLAVEMGGVPNFDPNCPCSNKPFTLTVTNNGPSAATNVTLTDILPRDPYSDLVAATVSVPVSSTPGSSCTLVNTGFVCSVGLLNVNAPVKFDFNFTLLPIVIARTTENHATVISKDTVDSVLENSTKSWEIYWSQLPSYSATINMSGTTSVVRPDPVSLNIEVVNNGNSTATRAMVTTRFLDPADSTKTLTPPVNSATSTLGSCSTATPGTVVCNLGTFVPKSPQKVSLTITPKEPVVFKAQATLTSAEGPSSPTSKDLTVTVK